MTWILFTGTLPQRSKVLFHLAVSILKTAAFQVAAVTVTAVWLANALHRSNCNGEMEKSASQNYSLLKLRNKTIQSLSNQD